MADEIEKKIKEETGIGAVTVILNEVSCRPRRLLSAKSRRAGNLRLLTRDPPRAS